MHNNCHNPAETKMMQQSPQPAENFTQSELSLSAGNEPFKAGNYV